MNILKLLNEGLETKYFGDILDEAVYGGAKWSNLSDEERQKCLDADPTYKGKEDSAGKYSEWILKIYSEFKKNHPNEKFRFEHCKDALTQFMRSKENLRDKSKKDIFQFKSLDELDSFLNNSQSFNNTFVEVPEKESSIEGAKKIFENNRCEIWVPLTHEASVALAGEPKTEWCTAYSNPGHYDSYTKRGPLFILIMKDNSGEMYQFHFERKAAMDKHDDKVKWEDFPEMQSQEVKNFRREYFKEVDDTTCKQIDGLLQEPTTNIGKIDDTIKTLHDEELANRYFIEADKLKCRHLDFLLDREAHLSRSEADVYRTRDLIKSIHDEDLAFKYNEPFDEWCLEQFYVNLTPTLTRDSPSIKYLGQCIGKVSITIPGIVTSLGDYCFSGCTSLTSITIPNGITNLGQCCFEHCTSLENITIPNSVTRLGSGCFQGCHSLTSITIPNSVTRIGDWCFWGCPSLESIVIPGGVTNLWSGCFAGCVSLTSITIPNNVTSIGEYCFGDCESLKNVYYEGSQEDRKKIHIGLYNSEFWGATWHYNWKGGIPE